SPDAIARFRRIILDIAVRGKLVPHSPHDEPASRLLATIAAERARLVRNGMLPDRPALPSVSSDEEPFELPHSWRWVRFANIAEFSAGRTPSRNDASFSNNGDNPWVSTADMEDGGVVTATKETISQKARDNVFASGPEQPGTIVMS